MMEDVQRDIETASPRRSQWVYVAKTQGGVARREL